MCYWARFLRPFPPPNISRTFWWLSKKVHYFITPVGLALGHMGTWRNENVTRRNESRYVGGKPTCLRQAHVPAQTHSMAASPLRGCKPTCLRQAHSVAASPLARANPLRGCKTTCLRQAKQPDAVLSSLVCDLDLVDPSQPRQTFSGEATSERSCRGCEESERSRSPSS